MSALSVQKVVARTIAENTDEPMWSAVVVAHRVLSALTDPAVQAGMAEVLGGRIHGCFDGRPGLYDEPCEQCWTAVAAIAAWLTADGGA